MYLLQGIDLKIEALLLIPILLPIAILHDNVRNMPALDRPKVFLNRCTHQKICEVRKL